MKKTLTKLLAIAVIAAASFGAFAQSSGAIQAQSPMTRDIGALQTHSARVAGTTSSSDQSGFNVSRVVCVFNQTTYTGNPSTTFLIQNKDAASGLYYTLITSAAITSATGVNTPQYITAGGGAATTANVSANVPIARTWRTRTVVAGSSTPIVTGTVGCSVQ
jgi:hypothetical protein